MKKLILQFLLKDKGITHEHIAAGLGVSRVSVSEVIRGETKSERIERAVALAVLLPVQDVFPSRYDASGNLLPRTRRVLNRHYSPALSLAALQAELSRVQSTAAKAA